MGAVAKTSALRRAHPWRFWIGTAAATAAVAITGYLGTLTVLWGLRVNDLRSVSADLTVVKADRRATVSQQEDELSRLQETLTATLTSVSDQAHAKARADDNRYVYHDFAIAFKGCATERAGVVDVVRQRYMYILWTVHRQDDSVAEYCLEIKRAWAQTLAEEVT